MASLTACLAKTKRFLDAGDVSDIRAAYDEFIADGSSSSDAAARSVEAILENVLGERELIASQIEAAGGEVPSPPPPINEQQQPSRKRWRHRASDSL